MSARLNAYTYFVSSLENLHTGEELEVVTGDFRESYEQMTENGFINSDGHLLPEGIRAAVELERESDVLNYDFPANATDFVNMMNHIDSKSEGSERLNPREFQGFFDSIDWNSTFEEFPLNAYSGSREYPSTTISLQYGERGSEEEREVKTSLSMNGLGEDYSLTWEL